MWSWHSVHALINKGLLNKYKYASVYYLIINPFFSVSL